MRNASVVGIHPHDGIQLELLFMIAHFDEAHLIA